MTTNAKYTFFADPRLEATVVFLVVAVLVADAFLVAVAFAAEGFLTAEVDLLADLVVVVFAAGLEATLGAAFAATGLAGAALVAAGLVVVDGFLALEGGLAF